MPTGFDIKSNFYREGILPSWENALKEQEAGGSEEVLVLHNFKTDEVLGMVPLFSDEGVTHNSEQIAADVNDQIVSGLIPGITKDTMAVVKILSRDVREKLTDVMIGQEDLSKLTGGKLLSDYEVGDE